MQRVILSPVDNGSTLPEAADALFIFIGTRLRSDWLPPEVLRDTRDLYLPVET